MSSERIAFLDAISRDPDADDLRLIYADWLDDNGDEARAEFIRVQCEIAQLDSTNPRVIQLRRREQDLLASNEQRWLDELRSRFNLLPSSGANFHRGFLERIVVWSDDFINKAKVIFERTPCRKVEILFKKGIDLTPLASCPELSQVQQLGFSQGADEQGLRALFSKDLTDLRVLSTRAWPHITQAIAQWLGASRLTHLSLCHANYWIPWLNPLLNNPSLANLRSLHLERNGLEAAGARALMESPLISNLTELGLSGNNLATDGMDALVLSTSATQLKRLDLSLNGHAGEGIEAEAMRSLARSTAFPQLESLDLSQNFIDSQGFRQLAKAKHFSNLRELILESNNVSDEGMEALSKASWLSSIRSLVLADCLLDDEALMHLSASPHLRPCRLDLGSNLFGDEGMVGLADSPVMDHVHELNLDQTAISDESVHALTKSDHTRNLCSLSIQSTGVSEEGLLQLAEVQNLPGLCELKLSGDPITDRAREGLCARFGANQF